MQLTFNANRMELLKLKRRFTFAVRGHKLLKDKQESMMQTFMKIMKDLQGLYDLVYGELKEVHEQYFQAQAGAETLSLDVALVPFGEAMTMSVTTKNLMGRQVPVYAVEFAPDNTPRSRLEPVAVGTLRKKVRIAFPQMVRLAQIEKQIEILAAEIEKTRRRVNALEYNLIPALSDAIHQIGMKLEERDRSERTVLMKIKDILK